MPSASACSGSRHTSSGRSASCCRTTRVCAVRPGCCGPACSSTTISRGCARCPAPRPPSTCGHRPMGAPLKDRTRQRASSIRTAGSRMQSPRRPQRHGRESTGGPTSGPARRWTGRTPRRRVPGSRRSGATQASGTTEAVRATIVVNAAGPWVSETLGRTLGQNSKAAVRLIKGSHIVTKKLYEGAQAYILQNPDKRIVFAIPYERDYHVDRHDRRALRRTSRGRSASPPDETTYLCDSINRFFAVPIASGRRRLVLFRRATAVRRRGEERVRRHPRLRARYRRPGRRGCPCFPSSAARSRPIGGWRNMPWRSCDPICRDSQTTWTADTPLPGGAMPNADFDAYLASFLSRYSFRSCRYHRRRGWRSRLRDERRGPSSVQATSAADLGEAFRCRSDARSEVDYLVAA